MSLWLRKMGLSKTPPPPPNHNCVCAFIPESILSAIEKSKDVSEEVRQSMRATLWTAHNAHVEREKVADKDKNPHEPNLPPNDTNTACQNWKEVKHKRQDPCTTVDIFDGMNSDYTKLPGKLVREWKQSPIDDTIVNNAYEAINKAQTFFRDVYGWDSLDDKNIGLIATVHYGWNMANAFFMGQEKQMCFGAGDPIMYDFAKSLDVVGHELTHGIVQFSSGLVYWSQSGALNEHCADVFGCLLEQWSLNQTTEEADWLVGQDVLFPDEPKIALRSMSAPGTAYNDPRFGRDTQPGHMKDYNNTPDDNYGVHINSGIPNKAFYLAATRKGGYAWETAGKTWFAAMVTAQPQEGFHVFAQRTIWQAKYFVDPEFAPIVERAWKDVGVLEEDWGQPGWFGWRKGVKKF